jgi:hypothetical protein
MRRAPIVAILAAVLTPALATPGCDRTETSTARVTTTSPAGTSAAPSGADTAKRDEALVRVVHAIPAGTPVDVFAGDLIVFDALRFKSVTSYRAVDSKRYAFAVRPAGMPNVKPLSTNTEDLRGGGYYTVFALPGDSTVAHLRIVGDDLAKPADGRARLRVVHAGADAGQLDIRATGVASPLFDGVDFQTVTNYTDIAPVNGAIEVHGERQPAAVASVPAHIGAGRFYTLVIVGGVRSGPKLEAFLIEDAPSP